MPRMRPVFKALPWLAVVVLLGSVVLAAPQRASAAYPGANGRIAFSSDRAGNGTLDLYTMNSDGSDVQQLTSSPRADVDATWSPGGTMIAFTRYTTSDNDGEIWVINADGTGLTRMTNHPADDISPTWSPDGAKIAWASNRVIGYFDIFTMPVTGGTSTNLTRTHTTNEIDPAWSPDRQHFAFISDQDGIWQLWLMNWNGYGASLLEGYAHSSALPGSPTWSADGSWIAFDETLPSGAVSVWAIRPDGSGRTRISDVQPPPARVEEAPAFAPVAGVPDVRISGDVLFDSNVVDSDLTDGISESDIFIRSLPDGSPVNLTSASGADRYPDWQPIPDFPLVDSRFSPFDLDIQWVFDNHIAMGCSAERYCPDAFVTRGEMAAFLARAFNLPAATADYFSDDDTSIYEDDINRVAEAGIATGCAPNLYCPLQFVSRQQMAAFLTRARGLPASPLDFFTDDETTIFEPDINAIAFAGITTGCHPGLYCPRQFVSRGQMAAFLHRALTWPPPD